MTTHRCTSRQLLEALESRICLSLGFAMPIPSLLGSASLLAAGDFNGDNIPDLLVKGPTNATNTSFTVRAHLGLGNGQFSTVGTPVLAGPNVSAIGVGDFNGDGKLDAAFANDLANGTVTIAFGHGDGTFGGPGVLTVIISPFVGSHPKGLTLGDFNGDGHLDILAANSEAWAPPGQNVPVTYGAGLLLGTGNGTFQAVRRVTTTEPLMHVAIGDVNHDGHADAVLLGVEHLNASTLPRTVAHTMLGDGQGGFSVQRQVLFTHQSGGLALQDLNGDGRDDLAVLQVLPVNSTTVLSSVVHTFLTTSAGYALQSSVAPGVVRAVGLSAADFNRDGKIDFAVAGLGPMTATNAAPGAVSVLLGAGGGDLAAPRFFRTNDLPLAQLVADVNRDGRPDIITGNASGVVSLMNSSVVPTTVKFSQEPVESVLELSL